MSKEAEGTKPSVEKVAQVESLSLKPCPVVGIGASAGGLEAFQTFFTHMPSDADLSFVLVQHLDPDHETLMPELLAKCTSMPVEQVEDETPVEPNRVYFIPPNATLTIDGGVLRVQTPLEPRGHRMPIDNFFRSLAEDQGGNAICVILSGSGSDGTLGLRSIKEHGGMAIAQEPENAKFDSMPSNAILTGMVDYVLPVAEVPGCLIEYARYMNEFRKRPPDGLRAEASDEMARICAILHRKTGHDFSRYKRTTLARRIQRRMQVLQTESVKNYVARLEEDPKETSLLFKDLLIGVTQFFRDPEAFKSVARSVVPALLMGKGSADTVRIWVTACSTGEECYSLAMILCEEMSRLKLTPRIYIFATDIDQHALDIARQGRYPEGIVDQVSAERLQRFFDKRDNTYEVKKSIREMCIFSQHDLIRDPPFSRLDLIACRNLLIYLESDIQKKLLSLFHYSLRGEGFLFLGPSENAATHSALFRSVDKRHRLYRRNDNGVASFINVPLTNLTTQRHPKQEGLEQSTMSKEQTATKVIERTLLENYAPPCIVINEQADIIYFSGRTGRYLEHPVGTPNINAISMARKSLRIDLRTAIHKAIKTQSEVVRSNIAIEVEGGRQRLNLVVRPSTEFGLNSALYIVVFQELGPVIDSEHASTAPRSEAEESLVQHLEDELRNTKEHLQVTVEELETSNEELRSSNEELLSMNEELQSTNEELQTSKEELQSINEELETVNSELRKKLEELDKANSDLENLFGSTDIATIFLDKDLLLKGFTPAATRLFRLINTDIGRPLTDITTRFVNEDLRSEIVDVMKTSKALEREVHPRDGDDWYQMRILPYRRLDGSNDGVVMTFSDVSEQKLAQQRITELNRDLKRRYETLSALLETIPVGIAISHDPNCETIITNAAASEMLGITPGSNASKSGSKNLPFKIHSKGQEVKSQDLPMQRAAVTGKPCADEEFEVIRDDGSSIRLLEYAVPLFDEDGKTRGCVGVFVDITERKEMEEALKEAGRQKDEFLAMLSHELRNPLAPLTTALHILGKGNTDTATFDKLRSVMSRQIAHLVRLVDDLLDVSRISQGKIVLKKEPLDLVAVTRDTITDLGNLFENAGLELKLSVPDEPVNLTGDRTRLSQMVSNILRNAAKFTERGGTVSLNLSKESDKVLISVTDTGIGIEKSQLDNIFNVFGQVDHGLDRSRGGLGLGLYLVKRIAKLHGGTVTGNSDGRNRGSEFVVTLPLKERVLDKAKKGTGPVIQTLGTPLRVLVIEDNHDSAEVMSLMLQYEGHTVETAHDGPSGLEAARRFHPDVILCDIGLPGMHGFQVAETIRKDEELKTIHLVALTGYGQAQDKRRCAQAGFDAHITKPASPQALARILEQVSGSSK